MIIIKGPKCLYLVLINFYLKIITKLIFCIYNFNKTEFNNLIKISK